MSEVKVMRQALIAIRDQSREITRLRAALEKYADHERWSHISLSDHVSDCWQGSSDDDLTPGWRIAEEALANKTQGERTC